MARPTKTGLDYFSFDVDFFENRKVKKVMRACGPASGTVLSCLLCNIYRWKGYYILWDEELPFEISDQVGVSEGSVVEIITKAVQVNFFDPDQYEKNKILTSYEIQKRFLTSTLKRMESVIDDSYLVIDGRNSVNDAETPVSGVGNTQSKVKESKVKERSEPPAPDPTVFFDAEKLVLENRVQFERIGCAAPKNFTEETIKEALRNYHLYLEEKERYPLTKNQIFSGFERWIMNEKKFNNASNRTSSTTGNGKPAGGKSGGANTLAGKLSEEIRSVGP